MGLHRRYPDITNYAYGSFTASGPVTALSTTLQALWSADSHGTANMTDDGSGLISSWKDLVGGLDATAATTARPTWAATSFEGVGGVTGDGVANVMTVASTTGLNTGTNESWIVILSKSVTSSNTETIFSYGTNSANSGRVVRKTTNDFLQGIDVTALSTTNVKATSPHICTVRFVAGGGSIEVYTDGKVQAESITTAASNTGTTRCRIFANLANTAATFSTATIRYIAILATPTLLQRQQLSGWMMHQTLAAGSQSGRSILPDDHPFKYRAP